MPTQTGSLDLKAAKGAHDEASKTATNYLSIDSTGIMVADLSSNSGATPSTATGKNVFIDSDSVEIRDGQTTVALFGSVVRVGKEDDNRIELNNYGMTAISSEGTPYFNVNASGASLTQEVKQSVVAKTFDENEGDVNWRRSHTWDITDIIPSDVWATVNDGESFDCSFWGILHDKEESPVVTPTERTYFLRTKSFVKGTTKSYDEDMNHNLRVTYNATNGTMYMYMQMTGSGLDQYYYLKSLCCQITIYKEKTAPYYAIGANMPDEGKPLAVAFGNGTIPSAYGIAMGQYNIAESDTDNNYALIIGNGADNDNRSNAFVVDWNGYIYPKNQIMADWIIEMGTSGDWYYEKWASGKIEARGTVTKSSISYSTSGNLYRSTDLAISIPSGIFPATPTFAEAFIHSSSTVIVNVMATPVSSTSLTAQIWKVNSTSNACTFRLHCVYYPSDY